VIGDVHVTVILAGSESWRLTIFAFKLINLEEISSKELGLIIEQS
jgi:hypothetical protein